jgi:hypothetical protein
MEGTHRALCSPLALALLLAGLWATVPQRDAKAQDLEVDLELVLAVDVSRSMDLKEQELQRNGYAQAISHPDVIAAIDGGQLQRIAVTYVEWAGPGRERVIVPWRLIDSEESAQAMTQSLSSASLSSWSGTSITTALTFSSFLFQNNGYEGLRRVIDISGDGPNNAGGLVTIARDQVIAEGITINGLPILAGTPGAYGIEYLDAYYEACVIGGPGAFMVTVFDMETFAVAIRQKLILEIAGRSPWKQYAQATREVPDVIDCAIGEKIRMRWEDH